MVINGKEIDFKITRISDAQNYERALKEMGHVKEELQKKRDDNDLCGLLEAFADMFRKFFITATGVDVVGECDDTEEMPQMYESFLKEIGKQQKRAFPFDPKRIK